MRFARGEGEGCSSYIVCCLGGKELLFLSPKNSTEDPMQSLPPSSARDARIEHLFFSPENTTEDLMQSLPPSSAREARIELLFLSPKNSTEDHSMQRKGAGKK